jgi:hypothetical protein
MIPTRTKNALDRYVNHSILPGDFLTAVLCNDLFGAMAYADSENLATLKDICMYVYWEIPGECWGNREKIDKWTERRAEFCEQ